MKNRHVLDLLKLQGLVFVLSLTAIFGHLITLPAVLIVLIRSLLASLIFWAIYAFRKERVPRKAFVHLLLIGGVLGLHWICFFGSAKLSNVSVSLITLSLTAFFTSIIEPLSVGKRIQKFKVFVGLLASLGMSFIFFAMPDHAVGILVGLLAAVLSSVYTVANKKLVSTHNSLSINTVELSGAFLICLFIIPFVPNRAAILSMPSMENLAYLFVLSVFCTVLPYLSMVNMLKKFTAFTINLSLNMEPIYGILLAWALFQEAEEFGWRFFTGLILILFSMFLNGQQKRFNKIFFRFRPM
ncbi:DMT family transporter [Marinilongibacter aquaticus]|uniref:DMT family transporter n=1 Tax=Marinilongibacter aquaticus TaxID=2975157 RepID=UPI0021BDC50D|nr:DMT family transporter [Marinilongibacter aquaticus]UBM60606.1 DMT family transporter [Marinilongibacter aquaticus]